MRGVRRFFCLWLGAGVLSACLPLGDVARAADDVAKVVAENGDAALCSAFTAALPAAGLKPQPSVCYRENESIPGGCATCLIGMPMPSQGATLAQMQALCTAGLPCHAEMVRSPLRADAADVRHPAVVFDMSQSVSVGQATRLRR